MSELEHCRLAHDGKLTEFIEKIESDPYEDLVNKKDLVSSSERFFKLICYKLVLQTGRTAIHWACVGGKKEIVDYLYNEFKVKLDEPDDVRHLN